MNIDLGDLNAFLTVARAGGFREGARLSGGSVSALSDAIRRLETRLGVRLFNRTTRSVALTAAGNGLLARLEPALGEVANALDVVNGYRDRPAGTLRLNIPVSAARLALPEIIPAFLAKYPEILLEIITEESFVDLMADGCDAGIRYDERLEQDMIAIPIGPRKQRFAAAASPDYLARNGTPQHPQDLLDHSCIRGRFASGAMFPWEFEKDDQTLEVAVKGPFIMRPGGGTDLAVEVAKGGIGIIYLFEDWLTPFFKDGSLVPILEEWWPSFPGPKLYYPGRRLVPSPLRAFIDFIRAWPQQK